MAEWAVHKVLVPVDFSASSKNAVDHALAIADRYNAEVVLMHAWQIPAYVAPEFALAGLAADSLHFDETAREEAARALSQFAAPYREGHGSGRIRTRLDLGDPAERITSIAEGEHFDLIVMGTHGRTGLERLMMGSIAEKVVRKSQCPVLTVHEEGAR